MCGIAGLLCPGVGNKVLSQKLRNSLKLLKHRGPDDCGIYVNDKSSIGLVHSRLSIIDVSILGHQPMVSFDNKLVIVFNGEIYNFLDLKNELIAKNYKFKGNSDTEVLLNLYIDQGENMLQKLNGIFAFAIWDKVDKTLFIARDGLGVKPLYFSQTNDCFAFSSEIKSLLCLYTKERCIDYQAVNMYLTYLWCPGEKTPLKGVNKLSPGGAMVIKEGKIFKHWNWYKLPILSNNSKQFLSKKESINGSLSFLKKSVRRQLIADVPVGAFLSGGLDSSAIVSLAKNYVPNIKCFTIDVIGGQESGVTDDLPYAIKVAKHLDIQLEVVSVDASKIHNDIEKMVVQLDEPIADPAPLNLFYICQKAKENGIKVLLSGAGGDDIFSGYRRHQALKYEKIWSWVPSSVLKKIQKGNSFNVNNSFLRRASKIISGFDHNNENRMINYFRWIKRSDLENLYSQEFKKDLYSNTEYDPLMEFLNDIPKNASQLDRMLGIEQRFFLGDHNLLYTDKMSMASGVEVRVPFLDPELVDFASNIPDKYKQKFFENKWVLKKAMEPYLPREVIYRAKSGFGLPLRKWLRNDLKDYVNDLLSFDSLKSRGFFNPDAVIKLIHQNQLGRIDASYTIFSLLCIEIWCRHYIDQKKEI